jgi:hypothetical protein
MHWKTSANVVGEGCSREYDIRQQLIQVTEQVMMYCSNTREGKMLHGKLLAVQYSSSRHAASHSFQ